MTFTETYITPARELKLCNQRLADAQKEKESIENRTLNIITLPEQASIIEATLCTDGDSRVDFI